MGVREVKKLAQVAQSYGAQIFQLKDGETIRAGCGRIAALPQDLSHHGGCERHCIVNQLMSSPNCAEEDSCSGIVLVGEGSCELLHESSCNLPFIRVAFVSKEDWLIRCCIGAFPRQALDSFPQPPRTPVYGTGLDSFTP